MGFFGDFLPKLVGFVGEAERSATEAALVFHFEKTQLLGSQLGIVLFFRAHDRSYSLKLLHSTFRRRIKELNEKIQDRAEIGPVIGENSSYFKE